MPKRVAAMNLVDKADPATGWPIFMMAEAPQVPFAADDKLLLQLSDRMSGELLKPSAAWLAERERRCAASEERMAQIARQRIEREARDMLRDLAPLLQVVAEAKAAPEAPKANEAPKAKPGKGGAS
jgi:hypothetical protein